MRYTEFKIRFEEIKRLYSENCELITDIFLPDEVSEKEIKKYILLNQNFIDKIKMLFIQVLKEEGKNDFDFRKQNEFLAMSSIILRKPITLESFKKHIKEMVNKKLV